LAFPPKTKIDEWVVLFAKLAKYATGLRVIVIDWRLTLDNSGLGPKMIPISTYPKRRGWGENTEFLYAFAEVRGLEDL
jgi:hypothetical protein